MRRRIGIAAAVMAIITIVVALGTGAGGSRSSSVAEMSSTTTGPRLTRVRLSTGVVLEVAQAGPADGEPVLFLHGYTDSWYSFTRVLEQLPSGIRAIVPSQRGHGDSDRPDCCYGVADFAADAVALLDALGIERANIVGHSNGSFYAQRIAIEYPGRVKKLVLVGSGATPRVQPIVELNEAVKGLSDPIDHGFVREFQATASSSGLPAEFLDRVVAESMKLPARVWHDVLGALVSDASRHDLSRIAAPTLAVSGALDPLWGASRSAGARERGERRAAHPVRGHRSRTPLGRARALRRGRDRVSRRDGSVGNEPARRHPNTFSQLGLAPALVQLHERALRFLHVRVLLASVRPLEQR